MPLNLAVIAGDGTGPEVVEQGLRVLDAVAKAEGFDVQIKHYPFGATHYIQTGHVLDDADLDALRTHDAIYVGAVGGEPNDPRLAGGVIEKGILLRLRFELDQYINLRPVRLYPGIETPLRDKTPDDIDLIVVRENTEDLYCGAGGFVRKHTPHEISTQQMISTRFGVERCVRYAYDLARQRKAAGYPGKLTLVHKTNVLTFAGDTWFRTFSEVGDADYDDVEREYHHVDACCMYLAARPEIYDVIVTSNMFGDIITDLGAAIAGGMGIAASGNLNPDPHSNNPSMFEPVHGTSPDIAGQNKANPLAAVDSLAMLLTETGRIKNDQSLVRAGDRVNAAIRQVTPKFAGKRLDRSGYSTSDVGQMILDAL